MSEGYLSDCKVLFQFGRCKIESTCKPKIWKKIAQKKGSAFKPKSCKKGSACKPNICPKKGSALYYYKPILFETKHKQSYDKQEQTQIPSSRWRRQEDSTWIS